MIVTRKERRANVPYNWREQNAEQRDYQSRQWRAFTEAEKASYLLEAAEARQHAEQKFSFLDACREGRVDDVAALLDDDDENRSLASVVTPGSDRFALLGDGTTALHASVMNQQHAAASLLISAGADMEARDHDRFTPFLLACGLGDLEMVSLLLLTGKANIEATGPFDRRPLHRSTIGGHVLIVKILIENNANVAAADVFGETAADIARAWKARCRDRHSTDFSLEKESHYQSIVDLLTGVSTIQAAAKGMMLAQGLAEKMAGGAAARRIRQRAADGRSGKRGEKHNGGSSHSGGGEEGSDTMIS